MPDAAQNDYHEPTMSKKYTSKSQETQTYEGQGQEGTHVFSTSNQNLIAIELKGLAAPGEALKNKRAKNVNKKSISIFLYFWGGCRVSREAALAANLVTD